MALELKTRDQFVQDEIAAIQAAYQGQGQFQFTVGSIVLAIVQAHGGTAMWEESLIQFVLARTRLATSNGADADSWVADFGVTRQPAVFAIDPVIFSSNTPTNQRVIPVNAIVSTDTGIQFTVIFDPGNASYNAALGGYVIAAGVANSDPIFVEATVAGKSGNVSAGQITVINSPIIGVNSVTNPADFTTGIDAQTDSQLRAYFVSYINSLSRATEGALGFAIQSVQNGLSYKLVENKNYDTDAEQDGIFYAVVDDGSGSPPPSLLASVTNAVNAYRGFTIRSQVKPPQIVSVDISANVNLPGGTTNPDYNPAVIADIETALSVYISLIPFGNDLFYTRVAQIIYNVVQADMPTLMQADVVNVTTVTVNGGTVDLTSTVKQRFQARTFTINIVNSTP